MSGTGGTCAEERNKKKAALVLRAAFLSYIYVFLFVLAMRRQDEQFPWPFIIAVSGSVSPLEHCRHILLTSIALGLSKGADRGFWVGSSKSKLGCSGLVI